MRFRFPSVCCSLWCRRCRTAHLLSLLTAAVALFGPVETSDAQSDETQSDVGVQPRGDAALGEALEAIRVSQKVPALLAAEVGPGGIVRSAATGVRKSGSNQQVALDDVFAIGSNGKMMTAALAGVLVDDGALDWTTTISDVFPRAPVHDDFSSVTLEQLLCHTSGLQTDWDGPEWATFYDEEHTPTRERQRMCRLVLSRAADGEVGSFRYSNLGYVVAAAMMEQATGKAYESLMRSRVFGPLGMSETEFYSARKLARSKKPRLSGHIEDGEPIEPGQPGSENPSVYAPASTIRTTLSDWSKFIAWTVRGEAGPVLKSQDTFDRLQSSPATDGNTEYGFGWIRFDVPGLGRVGQHAGSNTNQFALVWILPKLKRATLVVTNTGQPQAFAACDAATAGLLQTIGRK